MLDLTSPSNYHHTSQLPSLPNFMWKHTCPGPVLSWWERHPTHRKVADSIPNQDTYSGSRFNQCGKATDRCFSRWCFYKLLRNCISSPPTHHSIHYYKAFFFVHHTVDFIFIKVNIGILLVLPNGVFFNPIFPGPLAVFDTVGHSLYLELFFFFSFLWNINRFSY